MFRRPTMEGPWRDLEPEVRTAVAREAVHEIARRSISGAMVYFAVVVLLAISTSYYAEHPAILTVTGSVMLLVGVARTLAARSQVHPTLLWATIYATAISWGLFCAGSLRIYPVEWPGMFLMLSTAALASGVSSSLSPDLNLARRSIILLVAPTVASAVLLGDKGHVAFGFATLIYLLFLLAQAKGSWRAFWSANVAAEREKIRGSAERIRAERERATLAAAIEQAAEEILITDVEGRIQYCNPAFERLTGYSRAEVTGQNPRFLKSGNADADLYAGLWSAITRGQVWTGRLSNRKKDGSVYEAEGTISPIYDPTGSLAGFVSALHDVTERLRLESQLRQAQKLESIGRLAGGVAHDFNNLLTVIIGYSRLLMEANAAAPNPPEHNYAAEIAHAGERAASLTKQLLSFSRKQILMPRPVALDALIAKMQPMLQRLVGEDVKVTAVSEPALGIVRADPDQISQILMNLAANARDAMPRGGSLTIRATNACADASRLAGPAVLLSVSDTGEGMSEETRQRIFEPFFTTKEQGRGTGLGLATVYGIVKQSEGWVDVQSEPGYGTTFDIFLPRIEAAIEGGKVEPAGVAAGGTETILVVEDQEELRRLMVKILESRGFHILDAGNGRAALLLAADFPGRIDLLLTDVIMPDLTGKQVADEMARTRPTMKVLYTSGYSGEIIATRGILDQNVAYLPKPFTLDSLAAKVREVLGESGGVRRQA